MHIFITTTAGFIGYHLADLTLRGRHSTSGDDGITEHYDVRLKTSRHHMLRQLENFTATEALLEDKAALQGAMQAAQPELIVHLAAHAGERHSIAPLARLSQRQHPRHLQCDGRRTTTRGETPADCVHLFDV